VKTLPRMPYLTRTDSLNKHRKGTQGREQKAIQDCETSVGGRRGEEEVTWKQQLSSPCPLVNPKRTQGQTDPSKSAILSGENRTAPPTYSPVGSAG